MARKVRSRSCVRLSSPAKRVKEAVCHTVTEGSSAKECVALSLSLPSHSEEKKEEKKSRCTVSAERESTDLSKEVDKLEEEIGRRLQLISHKSEQLAKSVAQMDMEDGTARAECSMHCVAQPVTILPSSLPPKARKPSENASEGKMKSHTLASRVREGLADFTTGSSDRLQRWKNKLHNTSRRLREKDSSAPPPLSRSMDAHSEEVIVDWSTTPRPLHVSRSATNALTLGMQPSTQQQQPMEHRTLRFDVQPTQFHQPTVSHSARPHYYDALPPRLMPFSSSRAVESSDIIRPIAFRPTYHTDDMQQRTQPFPHNIEHTKSALNLSTVGVSGGGSYVHRPRAIYPSTSTSFTGLRQENEYDTVSDLIAERERKNEVAELCKMSSGSSTVSSIGNRKNRHSTGAHITPSPSDSGIVDYETIIRDKENELQDVRKTMEQNEEIIVKVYLEKERSWKEQLEHMKARLAASEKGEAALRMQMTSMSRQTEALNARLAQTEDEKTQMLLKMREMEKRECEECRLARLHNSLSSSSSSSTRSSDIGKPVPAPRTLVKKEDSDASLREEISVLRREVATLKDVLSFLPEKRSIAQVVSSRDRLI